MQKVFQSDALSIPSDALTIRQYYIKNLLFQILKTFNLYKIYSHTLHSLSSEHRVRNNVLEVFFDYKLLPPKIQ